MNSNLVISIIVTQLGLLYLFVVGPKMHQHWYKKFTTQFTAADATDEGQGMLVIAARQHYRQVFFYHCLASLMSVVGCLCVTIWVCDLII